MSLGLEITFPDPEKFPPLLRLTEGVQRPEIRRVMGRGIVNKLRDHFGTLERERPNALGGKRTHFWSDVRRSVQQPQLVGGDGIKVAINHVGLAQRYFGGEIQAGQNGSGKQWLTVPAREETYGKRAGEFDDLHFVLFRAGLAALVQNEQTSLGGRVHGSVTEQGRTKGKTIGGGVFYWLVKSVTQRPDPTVLPTEQELTGAALAEGEAYTRTLVERQGGL